MKILYILKHNPWGIGGGCYACRSYLEAFHEAYPGAEMDVLICEEYLKGADPSEFPRARFIPVPPRSRKEKLLTPLTGLLHRHQGVAKRMVQSTDYDLCVFDHNSIAGSLAGLCKQRGVATAVVHHNCEVDYFRDNTPSFVRRALLLPVVRRNERRAYREVSHNLFLTEEDKAQFQALYGDTQARNHVTGCFYHKGEDPRTWPLGPELRADRPRLVISGTIGNVQNMDGLNHFFDELYPRLPSDCEVVVAGKNPPRDFAERLSRLPNAKLMANPDDMAAIVRQCDVFLCPTRLGGGLKLRVMDGFRSGLPVIAHAVSARGYGWSEKAGILFRYETAEEFLQAFNTCLASIASRQLSRKEIIQISLAQLAFTSCVEKIKNL